MNRCLLVAPAVAWLALGLGPWGLDAQAHDWVTWRGPTQDGVGYERDLPAKWSPHGENLVWKQPFGGRGAPIIMQGRAYIFDSAGEKPNGDNSEVQERIACFDATTGKLLWHREFNVWHTDIDVLRLGWTNLAGDPETGNIYAMGTQGLFFCLDKDGKTVWQHSTTEEYGRVSGYGGRMSSPVVVDDLVVIGMIQASWGAYASPGVRWLAVNKRTGVPVWWSASPFRPKNTYSSVPVVAVINGEKLLITGGGDGYLHALKARTGERVWSVQCTTGGLSSSPVVDGNLVYICHAGGNLGSNEQGLIACFDASKVSKGQPKPVWKRLGIEVRYSSPALDTEHHHLYAADQYARLYCLDDQNGRLLWKKTFGRNSKGSPILADGKLYIAAVNGHFLIFELNPNGKPPKKTGDVFFPSPGGGTEVEVNGSPAVANGKVYFMTSEALYCIGKKSPDATPLPLPAQASETPVGQDTQVAHIQIVPADVLLNPGQTARFHVQTYNSRGQRVGSLDHATYELASATLPPLPPTAPKGPDRRPKPPVLRGQITPEGTLTVSNEVPAQSGEVVVKDGNLSTHARIRVAPTLPYRQDFEHVPIGATPAGWVNTQGKFVVVEHDGTKALRKLANLASPLFARAHAFISSPDLKDYTIESDIQAVRNGQHMPDIGLTNSRYVLILDGNKQELKIISWESTPKPRVEKSMEFAWKANVWYRMKLMVSVQGERGVIRGKVWQRGQPEPEQWTIEYEDPKPNEEGAPALYAYMTGIAEGYPTEAYYDNVVITPNRVQSSKVQSSKLTTFKHQRGARTEVK
ncbi:MAG TPA: PQQ-binding-like beta-propeller repeat protein [Gemmataceae bacterium]|nr:PQQ-binding-like beta-propeller repeat protein [Gemmataceae bacterium]